MLCHGKFLKHWHTTKRVIYLGVVSSYSVCANIYLSNLKFPHLLTSGVISPWSSTIMINLGPSTLQSCQTMNSPFVFHLELFVGFISYSSTRKSRFNKYSTWESFISAHQGQLSTCWFTFAYKWHFHNIIKSKYTCTCLWNVHVTIHITRFVNLRLSLVSN